MHLFSVMTFSPKILDIRQQFSQNDDKKSNYKG